MRRESRLLMPTSYARATKMRVRQYKSVFALRSSFAIYLHSASRINLSAHTIMSTDRALSPEEKMELIKLISTGYGYKKHIIEFVKDESWHVNKTMADEFPPRYTGKTCLHWACESWAVCTVQWLLDHGANCGLEDRYGNTPWDLVLERYMEQAFARRFELRALEQEWELMEPFLEHEKRQMRDRLKRVINISHGDASVKVEGRGLWTDWIQWYSIESLSVSSALATCGPALLISWPASTCACKHQPCCIASLSTLTPLADCLRIVGARRLSPS